VSSDDADGDGVTDGQEGLDGTDPMDACSFVLASQTRTLLQVGILLTVMVMVSVTQQKKQMERIL
jgi:hypothetical protein